MTIHIFLTTSVLYNANSSNFYISKPSDSNTFKCLNFQISKISKFRKLSNFLTSKFSDIPIGRNSQTFRLPNFQICKSFKLLLNLSDHELCRTFKLTNVQWLSNFYGFELPNSRSSRHHILPTSGLITKLNFPFRRVSQYPSSWNRNLRRNPLFLKILIIQNDQESILKHRFVRLQCLFIEGSTFSANGWPYYSF